MTSPTIHITDVVSYLGCRAKWHWTSPLGHSLTMKEANKHMWLGRVVHYALAAYYGVPAPRAFGTLAQAYVAEATRTMLEIKAALGYVPDPIKDYAQLGLKVLEHYALWAPQHDNFEMVMPEVPIKVERDGWNFSGLTDGILRDDRGNLWLLESKTSSRIPPEDIVAMSWQGLAYAWAASKDPVIAELGEIRGIYYNFLLKAPPTKPKVLVNGGLSKRANLRSTPEAYMQEVQAHGLDPEDYMDYASGLHTDTFFRRYLITYTKDHLQIFERRLDRVVHEMIEDPFIYPAESFRTCPGCEYAKLCKAYYSGQPYEDLLTDFVRSSHYQDSDRDSTSAQA